MEAQQPAFSGKRKADHLLRVYLGLPHLSSDLIHAWRLLTPNKPVQAPNICSRRTLRCAPTICLSMELNCLERLTSIYCLQSSSLLRTQLVLVFQIQRSSRSDEKSFHLGGSTLSSTTSIGSRIPRVRPITAFHSLSTGG